jgi:hypothetical protein
MAKGWIFKRILIPNFSKCFYLPSLTCLKKELIKLSLHWKSKEKMEFQNRDKNIHFLLPILWLSLDLEADPNCG